MRKHSGKRRILANFTKWRCWLSAGRRVECDQFSEGRCALSITNIATAPLPDSSFNPSCSCTAVKSVGKLVAIDPVRPTENLKIPNAVGFHDQRAQRESSCNEPAAGFVQRARAKAGTPSRLPLQTIVWFRSAFEMSLGSRSLRFPKPEAKLSLPFHKA